MKIRFRYVVCSLKDQNTKLSQLKAAQSRVEARANHCMGMTVSPMLTNCQVHYYYKTSLQSINTMKRRRRKNRTVLQITSLEHRQKSSISTMISFWPASLVSSSSSSSLSQALKHIRMGKQSQSTNRCLSFYFQRSLSPILSNPIT